MAEDRPSVREALWIGFWVLVCLLLIAYGIGGLGVGIGLGLRHN